MPGPMARTQSPGTSNKSPLTGSGYFTAERGWTVAKDLLKCGAYLGSGVLTTEVGVGFGVIAYGAASCIPALLGDLFAPNDASNAAVHDVVNLMDPVGKAVAVALGLSGNGQHMLLGAEIGAAAHDFYSIGAPGGYNLGRKASTFGTVLYSGEVAYKAGGLLNRKYKDELDDAQATKAALSKLKKHNGQKTGSRSDKKSTRSNESKKEHDATYNSDGSLKTGPGRITDDPSETKPEKPGTQTA